MAERKDQIGAASASREALRLAAFDAEDLAVISANLQDAIVLTGDMAWLPAEHRFALVASRFDWVAAQGGSMERCQTGLHFDHVRRASVQGFNQKRKKSALNLLSITFEETDAPGGNILLTFSGGAAVRIEVECLEARLSDLDLRWHARKQPIHDTGEDDSG